MLQQSQCAKRNPGVFIRCPLRKVQLVTTRPSGVTKNALETGRRTASESIRATLVKRRGPRQFVEILRSSGRFEFYGSQTE